MTRWPFRTPDRRPHRPRAAARFSFDGRRYDGFAGDTLASALLANGVHLVGRSFKYHRPRGILSAGVEEPNALVTIDRGDGRVTPNLRATQVELYDGLLARSQNRWPSLRFDFGAVNDGLSPLFPAGFYYKTFMWPRAFWRTSTSRQSAPPPASGARRRAPTRTAICTLRPLRRAGRRRRPGRPRRRARRRGERRAGHPLRRTGGVRRLAAGRDRRRSTASRAAMAGRGARDARRAPT